MNALLTASYSGPTFANYLALVTILLPVEVRHEAERSLHVLHGAQKVIIDHAERLNDVDIFGTLQVLILQLTFYLVKCKQISSGYRSVEAIFIKYVQNVPGAG